MVSPERLDALQQGWVRLVAAYGVNPADAFPVFDVIAAAYSAPDRHYHTLEHVHEVFRVTARLGSITDDTGPLHLAIWFHDAVYDSRAKDNEARSADLAVTLLGPIGVPASVLDRVRQLVLATAHLTADQPVGDRDAAILLDADLAILGASDERYRRYAADVRKEYAWVPEEDYEKARAAVLASFLARPRIYRHELLFQEGEQQARQNMRWELERLAAGR
jgi:predicted metal-dependent HD superfamily phosphohydrolase